MALSPSTSLTRKLRAEAARSTIDSRSACDVTGIITLSSRKEPVWPKATVASLPMTRATTIVSDSTMTGFTLPGMIEEPGWVSGSASSARPARGPMPMNRMSLTRSSTGPSAIARRPPWAAIAASSVAWAWKWFGVSRTRRPVSSERWPQARAAYSGWALIPVPTAVPPSGTTSSSSRAAWARRIASSTWPA